MLKELALYIDQHSADFQIGTNFFPGFRPDTAPLRCITILEATGAKPDFYHTDLQRVPLQFLVRNNSYFSARQDCLTMINLLHGMSALDLPAVNSGDALLVINTAQVLSGPLYLGQDDKLRHQFSVNFLLIIQGRA